MDRERWQSWRDAAPGFLRRQAKQASQLRYGWDRSRRLGFVLGCQRSGTKMVMWILDGSPVTRVFHENHASAFTGFQLRSDRYIQKLLKLQPAPNPIFKPICDSHRADELLESFPSARGAWIYRGFDDVANSAVKKWGDHQREVIDAVVRGDLERWGWRTARLPPSVLSELTAVHRSDLSAEEGALLFWYMRNAFFFSLGLDRDPRIRLVKYEALVREPEAHFPDLFEHLGARFEPHMLDRVRDSSVGRRPPPEASPAIRALCEGLQRRLDDWTAPPAPVPASALVLIDTLGVGGAERYAVTVSNWMAEQGAKVVLASAGGKLVDALSPEVEHITSPINGVRAELPVAALEMRRILREHQPEVIIANSLAVSWIARAAQTRRQIPIVTVGHGWPAERYQLVGPLMRVADRVVAVSPDVRDKLVTAGLPPERCQVIFNGVDCTGLGPREGAVREAARASMGAGPDDTLVIIVGRLEAQKAHQHVFTVAERLRERHPRLRFVVVGAGSRADELQAMVDAADLGDRVCLAGLRLDVADLLGSAEIYLNCSDWEGMPLTTIEAMAAGLPVVATRTEGSSQLLNDECGVIVEVADTEAMARAIEALAEDAERARRMGAAARERALASFSHHRMAGELMVAVQYARLQDDPGLR